MYVMNNFAKNELLKQGLTTLTISNELCKEEIEAMDRNNLTAVIYGKPVVMTSVNCVKKTCGICNMQNELLTIKDTYMDEYIVRTVCNHCYNVMYSKAVDLINQFKMNDIFSTYRIEFVNEDKEEVRNILDKLCRESSCVQDVFKGHYDRKTL